MLSKWGEISLFLVTIISLLIALAFIVGIVVASLLSICINPLVAWIYVRLFDNLERKRGTMSTTPEQQEV